MGPNQQNPQNPILSYPAPPSPYPVPTVPIGIAPRSFSPKELLFIQDLMAITPKSFLVGCNPGFDQKIRLLGIAALALNDLNNAMPITRYTFDTFPDSQKYLLIFGTQNYLMLMEQMRFSLIDISYSDGGLSLSVDRVSKIGAVHEKFAKNWENMVLTYKRGLAMSMGGMGLGTPRFQSNMGRLIAGMSGGSAFGWGFI